MSDLLVARGVRVAIVLPVTLLLLVGVLHLGPASLLGVFAVTGLLIIGDFRGPPLPRAVTFLLVGAVGAVMLVLGALAGQTEVTAVVGSAVAGFLVLLTGVYRGQFGRAGIPLLLPFLSEAANPAAMQTLSVSLLAWAVGSTVSTAGALLILPHYDKDTRHPRFAAACDAYADTIPELWPVVTPDAEAAYSRFAQAMIRLDRHWQGDRSRPGHIVARERGFISILDYLHQLQSLCTTRIQTGSELPASDARLPRSMVDTARSVAASLASGRPEVHMTGLVEVRGRQWEHINHEFSDAVSGRDTSGAQSVAARNFLLRVASMLTVGLGVQTEAALGGNPRSELLKVGAVSLPEWRSTPVRMLAQQLNPSSPWFRTAARGAVALALAIALARLPFITHGFWIVMGAIGALRFDAMGTGRTVRAAMIGQTVGFIVSFVLAFTLHPYPLAITLLIPVAAFAAGVAPPSRLWMPQAAFTILVVLCLSLLTPQERGVPLARFEDMLLGLAVSLFVSLLLWPRGIQQHVARVIEQAALATADLVRTTNRRLLGVGSGVIDFESAADHTRMRLREASEVCDLAALENPPEAPPTMSWTRLVMASRHLFFGCAILGNAPAVTAPPAVSNPLDEAIDLATDRFLAAQTGVLAALESRPGVDPVYTSTSSSLQEGPRPNVQQLAHEGGAEAVTLAPHDKAGVALVQTCEWDAVWIEHIEITAGRLEGRRNRILGTPVGT